MTSHPVKRVRARVSIALCAALCGAPVHVLGHGKPHEHGVLTVAIALEAQTLTIEVEMPLDTLVGFERRPRTDAERSAATAALARMRAGSDLFRPDAAAACRLTQARVDAPALESAGRVDDDGGHADLDASYRFVCAEPGRLAGIDVSIFDAFRRARRIDVQFVTADGQGRAVLRPPARRITLAR
jgi:hypothetical protein